MKGKSRHSQMEEKRKTKRFLSPADLPLEEWLKEKKTEMIKERILDITKEERTMERAKI